MRTSTQGRDFPVENHGHPWLLLTPDIQVVRGAQKEKFTIGRGPGPLGVPFIASRKSIGTATVLGIRMQMVF